MYFCYDIGVWEIAKQSLLLDTNYLPFILSPQQHREKASDLRCWLEAYRYWNQGGMNNVKAMLQLLVQRYLKEQRQQQQDGGDDDNEVNMVGLEALALPELEVTPDIGLLHPLLDGYASDPKSCEFLSLSLALSFLAI